MNQIELVLPAAPEGKTINLRLLSVAFNGQERQAEEINPEDKIVTIFLPEGCEFYAVIEDRYSDCTTKLTHVTLPVKPDGDLTGLDHLAEDDLDQESDSN